MNEMDILIDVVNRLKTYAFEKYGHVGGASMEQLLEVRAFGLGLAGAVGLFLNSVHATLVESVLEEELGRMHVHWKELLSV